MTHCTRRQALALALGATTYLSMPMLNAGFASAASEQTPLPIPPLLEPDAAGKVRLHLLKGEHSFQAGKKAVSAGVNGSYLGPFIRLQSGQTVTLEVENTLGEDTTMHWHGLFVPSRLDGGPHNIIRDGETWSPEVKVDQPASFNWFHPHLHGETARQTHLGLAGLMAVTDGRDKERGLPVDYGVDDLPIVMQDRRVIEGDNAYAPDIQDLIHGFIGNIIIVNGAVDPVASVPKGMVRLRLLNGANARNFHLRFEDGRPLNVVASDGGFIAQPVAVERLTIAPGERYEVLVDFADGKPVELRTFSDDKGENDELRVLGFVPDDKLPVSVTAVPQTLDDPGAADTSLSVRRRSFVFDERTEANQALLAGTVAPANSGHSGHEMSPMKSMDHGGGNMGGMDHSMHGGGHGGGQGAAVEEAMPAMDHSSHSGRSAAEVGVAVTATTSGVLMAIADEPFDMKRIDVEAKLGSYEIWELESREMAHPFHIHGASFRILTKNGELPAAHEMGWKDVMLVDGKAELLIRFDREADRDHPFMFHCHVLEHEDVGMMAQFITV
ncbi:MAG: multicopper oxidase CueO [Phyllobacterium sp.]